jgi:hypothetical protein
MRDTIPCPQCGAFGPDYRAVLAWQHCRPGRAAEGRLRHNHWLTPLAEAVARAQPDPRAAPAEAVPA